MPNPEHLAILKQGAKHWNAWRDSHPEVVPDLYLAELNGQDLRDAALDGADLMRAELNDADLSDANLSAKLHNASLSGAICERTQFSGAILQDANLSGAILNNASFEQADLANADLTRAQLYQTNFVGAEMLRTKLVDTKLDRTRFQRAFLSGVDFEGADFTETYVGYTVFADLDLSTAKGLEHVQHRGPSTIGIDTIYKSKGEIPDDFLIGCGVPDDLIAYIKSIAGSIQFYSCFISYATKDQEFADRLYADLQTKGVRCWFAPHDIRGGRKIHEQIDEAIRLHDKLLLILSEHSMASDWVQTEIGKARKREAQEKRQMLFPVALVPYDPVIKNWERIRSDGTDLGEEIREYFIPDFSNWKDHDSYQKAFQRLVGDLKNVSSASDPKSGA
jgi:uncharacterized protein YjbI with pentapeptide repeats